jgi:hypothetical protein
MQHRIPGRLKKTKKVEMFKTWKMSVNCFSVLVHFLMGPSLRDFLFQLLSLSCIQFELLNLEHTKDGNLNPDASLVAFSDKFAQICPNPEHLEKKH